MDGHDYSMSSLATGMSDVSLGVNGQEDALRSNPYASMYNYSNSYPVPNLRPDYLYLKYVLSDSGSHARNQPAVTCLAFDNREELLWMGNDSGHVTSYYGLDMAKYTSFQVHSDHDIRAQMTNDSGLLSLTKNALKLSIRRGLTTFTHTSDHFKDMFCMASTGNPSVILMGGQQTELLEFDLNLTKVIRITNIEPTDKEGDPGGCMIIRYHPKFVCCGDASGKVCNTMQWMVHIICLHF